MMAVFRQNETYIIFSAPLIQ